MGTDRAIEHGGMAPPQRGVQLLGGVQKRASGGSGLHPPYPPSQPQRPSPYCAPSPPLGSRQAASRPTARPSRTSSTRACASATAAWSRAPTRTSPTPTAASSSSPWTSEQRGEGEGEGAAGRWGAGVAAPSCGAPRQPRLKRVRRPPASVHAAAELGRLLRGGVKASPPRPRSHQAPTRACPPRRSHPPIHPPPSLDRCEWLDKKNTIFGRVAGDTIYNLIKLNDYQVGWSRSHLSADGPLHAQSQRSAARLHASPRHAQGPQVQSPRPTRPLPATPLAHSPVHASASMSSLTRHAPFTPSPPG